MFPSGEILYLVTFMVAAGDLHVASINEAHCNVTVITLCAQQTHDLLAIAKFLVHVVSTLNMK